MTANSELNCPGKSLQRSSVIMVLPCQGVESILRPVSMMEHQPAELQGVSDLNKCPGTQLLPRPIQQLQLAVGVMGG
jgi:hypothetical protein